jgi:hypothetical protein
MTLVIFKSDVGLIWGKRGGRNHYAGIRNLLLLPDFRSYGLSDSEFIQLINQYLANLVKITSYTKTHYALYATACVG